jgi:hypothetical protein
LSTLLYKVERSVGRQPRGKQLKKGGWGRRRRGLLMCSPTNNALSFWIESLIYERKRKQKKVGGMVDKKE